MSCLDDMLGKLDARGLPDPCPDGVPCCDGYAIFGPERCTCWEIVYNTDEQAAPDLAAPTVDRERMCGDCAFRPGSPERRDSDQADAGSSDLIRLVHGGGEFACHDGLRYGIGWRHPNGQFVPVDPSDGVVGYTPPIVAGRAYRVDGQPALRCAGLVAARKAKDWMP